MELEFKTEKHIIDFFSSHTGSHTVFRIAELLTSHNNPQDAEINHVRKILHKLKSENFLLVKNEGENIHEEKFSSTPDRIEKYYEAESKARDYFNNKNVDRSGVISFDYSNNNGVYYIGLEDEKFGINFSGASQNSIYVYNDDPILKSLAIVKGVDNFDQVNLNRNYDGTSRTRCPEVGQVVILKNVNDKYALLKILSVKMESRGDESDEVQFEYKIIGKARTDLVIDSESKDKSLVHILLEEIDSAYHLGDQELLESKRLEELENKIRSELKGYVESKNDEIALLKFNKLNSGWRNVLKSGFHNRETAESKLEKWREFLIEISMPNEKPIGTDEVKTIKNRFKTEGLFIESRSQDEDLHLLIGKRDGTAEKAHVVVDGKTAEIRVEDNQQEPTDLVEKVESILTLKGGKKLRVTREAIEELSSED